MEPAECAVAATVTATSFPSPTVMTKNEWVSEPLHKLVVLLLVVALGVQHVVIRTAGCDMMAATSTSDNTTDYSLAFVRWWEVPDMDNDVCSLLNADADPGAVAASGEKEKFLISALTGGFNNQRQAMEALLLLAKVTDRTLILPDKLELHHTDQTLIGPGDVFDLDMLSKAIRVKLISRDEWSKTLEKAVFLGGVAPNVPWSLELLANARFNEKEMLKVTMLWAPLDFNLLATSATCARKAKTYVNKYVTFKPEVFNDAIEIVRALRQLQGTQDVYYSSHIRDEDKKPTAFLECTARGYVYSQVLGDNELCLKRSASNGELEPLMVPEYLAIRYNDSPPANARSVMYVSTKTNHEKAWKDQLQNLGKSLDLVFWSDVPKRMPQLQPLVTRIAAQNPVFQSMVEQVICSYSLEHISSFASTWDEKVLQNRAFLNINGAVDELRLWNFRALKFSAWGGCGWFCGDNPK